MKIYQPKIILKIPFSGEYVRFTASRDPATTDENIYQLLKGKDIQINEQIPLFDAVDFVAEPEHNNIRQTFILSVLLLLFNLMISVLSVDILKWKTNLTIVLFSSFPALAWYWFYNYMHLEDNKLAKMFNKMAQTYKAL